MNDAQKPPYDNVEDDTPPSGERMPGHENAQTGADILIGAGLSLLVYLLIWALFKFSTGFSNVVQSLLSLFLVGGGIVVMVKLARLQHRTAAVVMLLMLSLPLLVLFLFGACSLLFMTSM